MSDTKRRNDPCMSCGSNRLEIPPDRCLQKASHVAGYQAEIDRLREAVKGEEYLHGCTRADLQEAQREIERLQSGLRIAPQRLSIEEEF